MGIVGFFLSLAAEGRGSNFQPWAWIAEYRYIRLSPEPLKTWSLERHYALLCLYCGDVNKNKKGLRHWTEIAKCRLQRLSKSQSSGSSSS